MEWYQHFLPRSTSIGSSSFWFQTPVHCLCSITALMLISAGSATQPAEKLTLRGDSTESPRRAQASRVKMSQMSAHWFASSRWTYGEFSIPCLRYTRLPINTWMSFWWFRANGWKFFAYCKASRWFVVPPINKLIKYSRCSLNSKELFWAMSISRFDTAHSRAGLRTLTFNASNILFNSTNGSFWLGSTDSPDSWQSSSATSSIPCRKKCSTITSLRSRWLSACQQPSIPTLLMSESKFLSMAFPTRETLLWMSLWSEASFWTVSFILLQHCVKTSESVPDNSASWPWLCRISCLRPPV